jgi:hypothetical protein
VFVMGVGLGPAMPLLNLAIQNAAQPHQIGAVTANRQFFQQFGQALGGAVFGVILTTTLASQLQQNFAHIRQAVPPALQPALNPARFQSSASEAEGVGGEPVNFGTQIAEAAVAPIEEQRTLTEAALEGNADARNRLLSSSETLPEVKALVAATSGNDPAAMARANTAINVAEQQVRAEAARIAPDVAAAVKAAFTTSITRIYLFAIPLSALALLVIALWLPETPLSKGRNFEPAGGE